MSPYLNCSLVACISEGRGPRPEELASLAQKACREAFAGASDQRTNERALLIARVALLGDPRVDQPTSQPCSRPARRSFNRP